MKQFLVVTAASTANRAHDLMIEDGIYGLDDRWQVMMYGNGVPVSNIIVTERVVKTTEVRTVVYAFPELDLD